jgi:hypothetical protein
MIGVGVFLGIIEMRRTAKPIYTARIIIDYNLNFCRTFPISFFVLSNDIFFDMNLFKNRI